MERVYSGSSRQNLPEVLSFRGIFIRAPGMGKVRRTAIALRPGARIRMTERIHRVKRRTSADAEQVIEESIHVCIHIRIRSKTKLTPVEFRNQFCA